MCRRYEGILIAHQLGESSCACIFSGTLHTLYSRSFVQRNVLHWCLIVTRNTWCIAIGREQLCVYILRYCAYSMLKTWSAQRLAENSCARIFFGTVHTLCWTHGMYLWTYLYPSLFVFLLLSYLPVAFGVKASHWSLAVVFFFFIVVLHGIHQ